MKVTNKLKRVIIEAKFVWLAWLDDAERIQFSVRATSLVYATLLSTIPALAIGFSLMQGLGATGGMESALSELLAPLGEHKEVVQERIIGFVQKVQADALGYTGLVVLVITVLSLISKLESALNSIWHITEGRSWLRRITDYFSVLVLAPMLFAAAGSMASGIASDAPGWFADAFSVISSLTLQVIAFMIMYMILPNTRVAPKAALAAAIVATVLWYASVSIFAWFAGMASSYDAIYSSFAAVMLLLLWLELVWSIVMLGAWYAYYVQYPLERPWRGARRRQHSIREIHQASVKYHLLLDVAMALVEDYQKKWPQLNYPQLETELSNRFGVTLEFTRTIIDQLQRSGLFVRTGGRLVPARAIATISVGDVLGVGLSYKRGTASTVIDDELQDLATLSLEEFRERTVEKPVSED